MRVSGSATLSAPREHAWAALTDPVVLARTLPGCRQLEEVGPGEYQATVYAGVASIKGLYTGRVAFTDEDPPRACTLRIAGQGTPGMIEATARVTLADDDDGTRIEYEADALVKGPVAGVGQRVLAAAARRNAEQFFTALDGELQRGPAPPVAVEEPVTQAARVFEGRSGVAAAPASPLMLVAAAVVGAAIALAGVAVGRRLRP